MATFVSCVFTDTSGTALESHTPEGTGDTWTEHGSYTSGALVISDANRARTNSANVSTCYASGTPASAEYDVQTDIRRVTAIGGTTMGIAGRIATGANTMYTGRYTQGAGWNLQKIVAGAFTQLGSASFTNNLAADGDVRTLKLEIRDATKKVFVDSTEVISSADNAITAAGVAGIRGTGSAASNTTGYHVDNFSAADPAGGGGQTLSLPLITSTEVVYIPIVTPGAVTLSPPLLTNTSTLYTPAVSGGVVTLSPPLLTNTSTLYTPTVYVAGGLILPLLTNTSTLYAPTVTVGAVTLSPPLIASTVVLYAPVILGNQLNPPLIVSTTTFYAPTLTTGETVLTVGFLISSTVLFPPLVLITIPDVATTRYSQEVDPGAGVEYSILTSRART